MTIRFVVVQPHPPTMVGLQHNHSTAKAQLELDLPYFCSNKRNIPGNFMSSLYMVLQTHSLINIPRPREICHLPLTPKTSFRYSCVDIYSQFTTCRAGASRPRRFCVFVTQQANRGGLAAPGLRLYLNIHTALRSPPADTSRPASATPAQPQAITPVNNTCDLSNVIVCLGKIN